MEDVDGMILETDVDDDAQLNERHNRQVCCFLKTAPPWKIKTVVKRMEDGVFYSHEGLVSAPEGCGVRIELSSLEGLDNDDSEGDRWRVLLEKFELSSESWRCTVVVCESFLWRENMM